MAGADPTGSFGDGSDFKAGIGIAMAMGLPNAVQLRPTFHWVVDATYADADSSGWTYDLGATPISWNSITDKAVNCAVEYQGGTEMGTIAGFENAITIKLTLLDADYNLLIAHGGRPPDEVFIANATYTFDRIEQTALFTVDVYTIYCTAVDQP
jgi:hypothetical protein